MTLAELRARALYFGGSRFNENHDPDTGQFASGSGGGSSGGAVAPTATIAGAASHAGFEFVSPNVQSDLDFGGAQAALSGDQQQALREASVYINGALGIHAQEHSIIGAWADGAENSVMDIINDASWDKLVLSGSMKGYIADQKQVLIFRQEDNGAAALSKFEATGTLETIHRDLLADGLAFHTLVPHAGGATVYVVDLDGTAFEAVEKGAERYDSDVEVTRGRAEFLGTQKQDGTDRAQRDDARSIYQGHINQSPVQGSKEVWARVRDRWGAAGERAAEVTRRFASPSAARAYARYFTRYNENHDPDTGEFTSGSGGGSGGSVEPTAPTPATVEEVKSKTPVALAAGPHAEHVTEALGEKKGKLKAEDFVKDNVALGNNVTSSKEKIAKFLDVWEERVGETPAEFRQQFLGGLDGTLTIEENSGEWDISGVIKEGDERVGTYRRTIDWRSKTAGSEYFALNSRSRGKDTGKRLLAGNVAIYKKLGIEKVKVHANIDVGGYAWAKYGYVPTRQSWSDLSSRISRKLTGGGRSSSSSSSSGDTYTPESWDEISEDDQSNIKDAWMRSTRSDFVESETDNWRDSGQALDDAKYQLADNFDGKNPDEWATDAVDEVLSDHDDPPIPYNTAQILAALSVEEYQSGYEGRKDPDFTFDDDKLRAPSDAPDPAQMALPGFKTPDLSAHLTEDMRSEIIDALTKAFNDKAESDAQDMDPPDFSDSVDDYQSESWEGMRDRDKYNWARDNGELPEIEVENDDDDNQDDDEPVEPESDEVGKTLQQLAASNNPKAVWAIADSPQGKDLLLNSDWYGTLDLKDKESMDRFNAYVGKSKRAAA